MSRLISNLNLLDEASIPFLIDAWTFVHLAALAAGLGAVIFADSTIISQLMRRTTRRQIAVIEHAHSTISFALVLLWASGLALLGLKAGFDPANFSPKLTTKLWTVSVLTVTAYAMANYALPYIRANVGRRLIDAPLIEQCQLAVCAGMSAAGWGTALLLGSSKILKTADPKIMLVAVGLHGLAIAGALATAIALDAVRRSGTTYHPAA